MTVTLPDELKSFVEDKVAAGAYASDAEVIRTAVTMMKNNDAEYQRQLQWLRDAIELGWEQAKAGQLTSAEDFEIEFEEFQKEWLAARAKTAAV